MWHVRIDRGLIYQHALLRAKDSWTVPPKGPDPRVSDVDFDALLQS